MKLVSWKSRKLAKEAKSMCNLVHQPLLFLLEKGIYLQGFGYLGLYRMIHKYSFKNFHTSIAAKRVDIVSVYVLPIQTLYHVRTAIGPFQARCGHSGLYLYFTFNVDDDDNSTAAWALLVAWYVSLHSRRFIDSGKTSINFRTDLPLQIWINPNFSHPAESVKRVVMVIKSSFEAFFLLTR